MIKNAMISQVPSSDESVNLYHLGIQSNASELNSKFGDVKVVVMGGKCERMRQMACDYSQFLKQTDVLDNLAENGQRYSMYLVKSVIFLSHGMGNPSISIALHEVTKLLHFAGVTEALFMRVGTCGGVSVKPGSIVLSEKCYNSGLEPTLKRFICGQLCERSAILTPEPARRFKEMAARIEPSLSVTMGNTYCADDFYEEQARLDGAINEIEGGNQQKLNFLRRLSDEFGIKNIEMESVQFAGFCHSLNIRAIIAALVLVDRCSSDQIQLEKHQVDDIQSKFNNIIFNFISSNHDQAERKLGVDHNNNVL